MSFEAGNLMNGRGVAAVSKERHPGEAGLDHLRKQVSYDPSCVGPKRGNRTDEKPKNQVHGSSLDTVKLESEMSVLDSTSTSLHRAASHGGEDFALLKPIFIRLQPKQ